MSAAPPPNILLVMADQLAAGVPADAPAMDGLTADGVSFDAAYCPSPLCAPSRAAMLTGLLPSRTGVFDNAAEMRASLPTVTHHLRAAGYATTLAGKMHFVGPDQHHGFEERLTPDVYPAGLEWTPDWRAGPDERLPWYHTMGSVLEPAATPASMQTDYDDEVAFHAKRALFDHARRRAGDPFFLVASFTHPHDPWEVPQRFWDRYDAEAVPMPAVGPIPLEEADPHSRRLRAMSGIDAADLTEEQIRVARHGYLASVSFVDERIGRVLAALAESGLEENTIVVLTADHGEMLGERGLWFKMAFFEGSARVPLVVRLPRRTRAGTRVTRPVSLLDLMPTLLALAGLEVPEGLDGTSLAGLLSGDDGGPEEVVAEYLAEGACDPAVMVRRGAHKYIRCGADPELLYDLEADPHELRDLAAAEPEVLASLRAAADARWDLDALRARVLASQDERRTVLAALGRGRPHPWDFRPEGDGRYVSTGGDLYDLQRRARLGPPGFGG